MPSSITSGHEQSAHIISVEKTESPFISVSITFWSQNDIQMFGMLNVGLLTFIQHTMQFFNHTRSKCLVDYRLSFMWTLWLECKHKGDPTFSSC